ncbi:hypothetical protein LSPH26S_05523 [Lysinibacillus sphaericus]
MLAGDWDIGRYGILQGIEYKVLEEATLSTIVDVAQYVAFELQGNAGIKSESIAGMSQSFDSADERNNTLK